MLGNSIHINLEEYAYLSGAYVDFEKQLLAYTMQKNKYNQVQAARDLNISRGTLRSKLKKYFGDKYFSQKKD